MASCACDRPESPNYVRHPRRSISRVFSTAEDKVLGSNPAPGINIKIVIYQVTYKIFFSMVMLKFAFIYKLKQSAQLGENL